MNPILKYLLVNQGKLQYQDFITSGTFTPSADLLTKGGNCLVILLAGGGGGSWRQGTDGGAVGGDAGQLRIEEYTVSGATSVTIGAGGLGAVATGGAGGTGGNSGFGTLTSIGGVGGDAVTVSFRGRGGKGAMSLGFFHTFESGGTTLDTRGGKGWSGRAGGGGGTCSYGAVHMQAFDGAGSGSITVTNDAVANSGAGGGGYGAASGRAGNGGSGWCRVIWFE